MHRSTRLLTGLATVAVASGGALAVAPVSEAAAKVTKPIDCPTAFPTSKAVKGVVGTGFTVESGVTPAPFTASVLGRLTDFLEPGTDLIMAKLSSPALSRAHGVWAGMSGSPVYSSDGRLIGSVSETLGVNTDVAGITPASALLPVLGGVGVAAVRSAGRSHLALTPAQIRSLVDAGVPAAAAAAGFSRIPLPVSVSGKPTKQALDAVTSIPDVRLVSGGAHATSAATSASQIHAGGNFVAAISYGDASLYGTGTTTVVCSGKAVAFGHPFFNAGATQLTAHPATAVYVQPDSLFGASKLVNPGGPVGVVDTDRTFGIRAVLGAKPTSTTAVTSSFTLGSHPAVTGSTSVVYRPFTGTVAAQHVYLDTIKALGYEGRGSAKVTFMVKGVRGNGTAVTLTRRDVYADSVDLPAQLAGTVYSFVDPLVSQEFEDVRVTGVSVTGTLDAAVHRYSVGKVEARQGTTWVTVGTTPIRATAGRPILLRVTLTPYKGVGAARVIPLSVPVPASSSGNPADLELTAGSRPLDTSQATSLDQILSILNHAAANDELRAQLLDGNTGSILATASTHVGTALATFDDSIQVTVA